MIYRSLIGYSLQRVSVIDFPHVCVCVWLLGFDWRTDATTLNLTVTAVKSRAQVRIPMLYCMLQANGASFLFCPWNLRRDTQVSYSDLYCSRVGVRESEAGFYCKASAESVEF